MSGTAAFPKITVDQIETAEPGLYELDTSPTFEEEIWASWENLCYTGMVQTMVRIDDRKWLPHAVIEARFRADGKRVVVCSCPISSTLRLKQ